MKKALLFKTLSMVGRFNVGSDNKPVLEVDFWRKRLNQVHASGRGLYTAIWDIDQGTWEGMQRETAAIIKQELPPYGSLLDYGCGYGSLFQACIESNVQLGAYTGLDLSPDLIDIARMKFDSHEIGPMFYCGTYLTTKLLRRFDIAVCRSIRQMLLDNGFASTWVNIASYLLQVSRKIVIIEYDDMTKYEVIEGKESRLVFAPKS